MRLKSNFALLLVALIWGSSFISQDISAQYHIAYLFNGASFLIGGLVLIPFKPRGEKISREQWKWMFISSIILFFASTLQQVGIFYTQIANAVFLTSLYVVFVPFILWVLFREKAHKIDREFQLWQEGIKPKLIQGEQMMRDRIDYIHNNPVKRGYVDEPHHWKYSSARDYLGIRGLLEVERIW